MNCHLLFYLIILFWFLLNCMTYNLSIAQTDTTQYSKYAILVGTGISATGTKICFKYNLNYRISTEISYGIDLAIIPFWGAGPISNRNIIGITLNAYPINSVDIIVSISGAIFTKEPGQSNSKCLYATSYTLGYITRKTNNIFPYARFGIQNKIDRSSYINIEFGFGYQF